MDRKYSIGFCGALLCCVSVASGVPGILLLDSTFQSGSFSYYQKHFYDLSGVEVSDTSYKPDGTLFKYAINRYVTSGTFAGKLSSVVTFNSSNQKNDSTSYTYDSTTLKERSFKDTNFLSGSGQQEFIKYNTTGQPLKDSIVVLTYGAWGLAGQLVYTYHGYVATGIQKNSAGQTVLSMTITYDSSWNMVKKVVFNAAKTAVTSMVVNQYNTFGQILKTTSFGTDTLNASQFVDYWYEGMEQVRQQLQSARAVAPSNRNATSGAFAVNGRLQTVKNHSAPCALINRQAADALQIIMH